MKYHDIETEHRQKWNDSFLAYLLLLISLSISMDLRNVPRAILSTMWPEFKIEPEEPLSPLLFHCIRSQDHISLICQRDHFNDHPCPISPRNSLTVHLHFPSQFILPPSKMPISHHSSLSQTLHTPSRFWFSPDDPASLLLEKLKHSKTKSTNLSVPTTNIPYLHQWMKGPCQCLRLIPPIVP